MKKHILSAVAILVIGLGISSCSDYLSVERFLKIVKVKRKFQEQEFYGTMAGQMLQLSVRNKFRNHTYRLFHN